MPPVEYEEEGQVNAMVRWLREQMQPSIEIAHYPQDVWGHSETQVLESFSIVYFLISQYYSHSQRLTSPWPWLYQCSNNQVVIWLDRERAQYQREMQQLADVLHHHDTRVIEVCQPSLYMCLCLYRCV